jgi:arylsulfatase A-like enzyme
MSEIDEQVGRVLSALQELGIDTETAVLCSTDHGDLCGSHRGMHDKNAFMIQELMHIPLMARVPGLKTSGERPAELVSNLDVPATIVDLAGAEVPDEFDGQSFLPILRRQPDLQWRDFVAAECYGVHFAYETRMVVHDGHKYVFHPGAFDELYDLDHDPAEMENLIGSPAHEAVLRECRRRLLQWMGRTRDPMQRAFFLFADRSAYSGAVSDYGPQAGNVYWSRDPVLKGDAGG